MRRLLRKLFTSNQESKGLLISTDQGFIVRDVVEASLTGSAKKARYSLAKRKSK